MGNTDSHHSGSSRHGNPNSTHSTGSGGGYPQSGVSAAQQQQQQALLQQQQNAANAGPPAPPGAYRIQGQPKNTRFYVTIPRGVVPGQMFQVIVNGQPMMVKCPEENKPGDRLILTAPRQQQQQYVVTVPANVRPGEQFRVSINNQDVNVTCPRNVRPGQRVTFQLPTPQERPQQAAPNHQMFEVTVPEGVRPRKCHITPSVMRSFLCILTVPVLYVCVPQSNRSP
jgi:hypothetical protein